MSSSRRSGASPRTRGRSGRHRPVVAPAPARRSVAWYAPRVGWIAVQATWFLVIVAFLPGGTEPFSFPKLFALITGVAIGGASLVCWRLAGAARVPVPRVGVAAVAYLAAAALATALSVSPVLSLVGRASRHSGLLTFVALAALAWLVVAFTWRRPERLERLLVVAVVGVGVHVLFVLAARLGFEILYADGVPAEVPHGTIGNSNFAGAQIVIAMPFLVYLRARSARQLHRWLYVAAFVVFGVGLALTEARGAALGLFPALAVAGGIAPSLVPRWASRIFAVLSVATLVVVVLAATGFSGPGSRLTDSATLTGRVEYWKGSIGIARAHPIVGTGPDTFGLVFPPHAPPDMTGRPFPVDKPHNIVLERLTESGALGMLSYLAVLGLTASAVWSQRCRVDGRRRELLAGYAAAFVAYLVQGMTSIDAVPLAVDGWVLLAGLAVLADPWVVRAREDSGGEVDEDERREDWGDAAGRVRLPVVAVLAIGVIVLMVGVTIPWIADRQFRDAFDVQQAVLKRRAPPADLVAAFDRASATNPYEPRIRRQAAEGALRVLADKRTSEADRRMLAEYARQQVARALEQEPGDWSTGLVAAEADVRRAQLGAAEGWADADRRYRELEAFDPYNSLMLIRHAEMLIDRSEMPGIDAAQATRDREEARALLARTEELGDDSWWFLWYAAARGYDRLGLRDRALETAKRAQRVGPDTEAARLEVERFIASR